MIVETIDEQISFLIVDDDPDHVNLLKKILTKNFNCTVNTADSGKATKQYLEYSSQDIILLDIHLPDVNGLDLLKEIKQNPLHKNSIVVLISGESNKNTIIKGLTLGARDFITKPFNITELKAKLKIIYNLKTLEKENITLIQTLQEEEKSVKKERDLLSKFFSKELIELLLNHELIPELGGKIINAAILVCDIRNSTSIAENITPEQFTSFLGDLFTDIADLISGQKGSLNKFLGDGLLASFGCPKELDNPVLNAVQAALNIRQYMKDYNSFRPDYLTKEISVGMGIAYGEIFAGNVGSSSRMEYTVLGQAVLRATKLESLTKKVQVDFLIDKESRKILKDSLKVKKVLIPEKFSNYPNLVYFPLEFNNQ